MRKLSIDEIRAFLLRSIGAACPVLIKGKNAEAMICFVRGFADEHRTVALISEACDSWSMNIIELKHINHFKALQ